MPDQQSPIVTSKAGLSARAFAYLLEVEPRHIAARCGIQSLMNKLERITVNPAVMSGKPCIRGMRVTVANVLRLLAAGHTPQRVLTAYPYLEPADIDACLLYASVRVDDEELPVPAA